MYPPEHLSPLVSAFVVYGIAGAGGMFVVAFTWSWARRHARRAEAAAQATVGASGRPPVGAACVAGVVVAMDEDQRPPLRVTLRQHGTEVRHKGRWHTTWKEVARLTHARPFLLRTASGHEVQVIPDDRVLLVDGLTETRSDGHEFRNRIAVVSPGDRVFVTGRIEGGGDVGAGPYRGGGGAPRLVAPPGGRMLVSTEPLTARHRRREKVHRRLCWIGVAYLVVAHLASASYHQLQIAGDVVTAPVAELWTYQKYHRTRRSGYWQTHYAVAVDTPVGRLESDVRRKVYEDAPSTVPFRIASPRTHVLGASATLADGRATLIVVMALLIGIFGPISVVATRDWWDRKLVEKVPGRLAGVI